jgi:hypothetical protein
MGMLDFLRREKPRAYPCDDALLGGRSSGRHFDINPTSMFDIAATRRLDRLFRQVDRGAAWQSAFFAAAWNASVSQPEFPHFDGPDGMPYFRLDLPTANTNFSADCLANLSRRCLDVNAGAAFFANADDPIAAPQFVLSMGVIDSLLRYDSPNGDPADRVEADRSNNVIRMKTGDQILCASPSADYLPEYSARALHRYMTRVWRIEDPRVSLMINKRLTPARNLVIGRKQSSFLSSAEIESEMARLLWFLPPNRSLILMPEDWALSDMDRLNDLFA